MKNHQNFMVLPFLLIFCFQLSNQIYVPENDQQHLKPVYTSGIKTVSYLRPSEVEYHHNYSKVNHHSYPGNNWQEEPHHHNAHTYGNRPSNYPQEESFPRSFQTYGNRPSERLTQIYILNGTRIGRKENPVRQIAIYNKENQKSHQIKPYTKCPFNATGQFIYELSCNQFLNCWKGRGFVQTCSPGTLFNPKTLECDFPEKVACVSGPRLTTYEPQKSEIRQIGCPHEFSGLIPNYTDCSKFINCVSGIENFMDCPSGTLFDVDKNICDFAHKANCFNGENKDVKRRSHVDGKLDFGTSGSRTQSSSSGSRTDTLSYKSNEVRCPLDVDGLHPHPSDCSKFLNCDRGQTYIQDCAPGTLFNPGIKICDFPYNVRCQNQQTTKYTEVPVYTNHHEDTTNRHGDATNRYSGSTNYHSGATNHHSSATNHLADNYNTQYDNYGSTKTFSRDNGRPNRYPDNHYYDQNLDLDETTPKTYGFDQEPYYHQPTYVYPLRPVEPNGRVPVEPNRRVTTYGQGGNSQNYWNQKPNNWFKDPPQHDLTQPLPNLSPYSGNTYKQNHWNQKPNTYATDYPIYVNRGDSLPNQRHDHGYNGSNYGHNSWGLNGYNQENRNSGYDFNISKNTDSSHWNLNPHQNYYRPDAIIRQRGETGYNNQPQHSWWPHNNQGQETFTPNYDQVVNINHHNNYNNHRAIQPSYEATSSYRPSQPPYRPSQPTYQAPQPTYRAPQPSYPTTQPSYRNPFYGITTTSRSNDYEDTVGINHHTKPVIRETTPRILEKHWPPPFPSTDVNADYVFEYEDDNDFVTLKAENSLVGGDCGKSEFHCSLEHCIPKTLLCNGAKDCPNGDDEINCLEYVSKYSVRKDHKLAILEKERWDNVSIAACASLCSEARKFRCRSFNYRKVDKTCFLTDTNEGLTGALISYYPFDYYESINEKIDCSRRYVCTNKKCIERSRLCDGVDDCGDRLDEKGCKPEDFGYRVRLTGSKQDQQRNEGNIEVTAFGKTGYVCDDNFDLRDADVVCRELGFQMGALEVKKNSYFEANPSKSPFFMMDDVSCLGNETRLMDCDFSGWGIHNCLGQEIAGVVCKTPQENCPSDYWQCESRQECLPLAFVCDSLLDCSDGSDEKAQHCDSPTQIRLVNGTSRQEGRVEIKHHGTWGTICDDDFNEDAAKVICRYLGYKGSATVRKEAYFGPGSGPIWLDQVFCSGNETKVEDCSHWNWGEHNCEHSEDVGVICSNIYEQERHSVVAIPKIPATYPHRCGYRKDNIFDRDDDVHFRVVRGSLAKKGDYPWQAAIRVKGKTSSSKTVNHWCGAVIISEKFVLTAAHCLMGYPKGAYVVVAGDYDVDEDEGTEQELYIEDFYIHEHFREGHKMNNDIALVKLKGRGFRFNDDIQPICLPDNSTEYEKTELNCTISGFGSIQSGKSAFSHQLRAGWVPIQKKEICKMPHVYGDALTEGMICAGTLDEGIDACDGDSGGPLACLNEGVFTLYGITSWGQHCGYANKPGVYVKVAHYRKWIDDIFYKHNLIN